MMRDDMTCTRCGQNKDGSWDHTGATCTRYVDEADRASNALYDMEARRERDADRHELEDVAADRIRSARSDLANRLRDARERALCTCGGMGYHQHMLFCEVMREER